MEQYAIGVDIGGTTVKGAVITRDGLIREKILVPTVSAKSGQQLLDMVVGVIADLIKRVGATDNLLGVGIGTPGFVDRHGTITGNAVNLPEWQGTNLYDPVMKRFGVRATAANDATAMTLAEIRFGAGRGAANCICLTLGTGIGGGIVIEGKVYKGSHAMAGELGHVSVDHDGVACGCGQKGCVERYASAPGIVFWAREFCARVQETEHTSFVRMVIEGNPPLTSKIVYEYVQRGDPVACRVNEFICDKLARALGIFITTLAPDRVVLGGGVMMAGRVIIATVTRRLPRYCLSETLKRCDIRCAELGEDAGVIGAGYLVFESEPRP
ncbi:MAG: ROK family protein [Chitinispirillaceae bacterium]|nr:ROK family protein [Chitinispirillaceae bacterium]